MNESFFNTIYMKTILNQLLEAYRLEYLSNFTYNFYDFYDFSDWYINKEISDYIIDSYENYTGLSCEDSDYILDKILGYIEFHINQNQLITLISNNYTNYNYY